MNAIDTMHAMYISVREEWVAQCNVNVEGPRRIYILDAPVGATPCQVNYIQMQLRTFEWGEDSNCTRYQVYILCHDHETSFQCVPSRFLRRCETHSPGTITLFSNISRATTMHG